MSDVDQALPPAESASNEHRRQSASARPIVVLTTSIGSIASTLGVSVALFWTDDGFYSQLDRITLIALAVICAGFVIAKLLYSAGSVVATLHVMHLIVLIFLLRVVRLSGEQMHVVAVLFLIESALYFPAEYGRWVIGVSVMGLSILPELPLSRGADLLRAATAALLYALAGGFAISYVLLRDRLVSASNDLDRLDNAVSQLTRTSLSYQEYAQTAAERSEEAERQRITRDVHDIVGYTLTNNIMMMEAATDMIRRNPLGVTSLIDAARENAQDGLEQIRASLYELRARDSSPPSGLAAIDRLIRIFRTATAIEVKVDYGDTPLHLPPEIDSVVYHFVQEGLINSFRHGRATKIDVICSGITGRLNVTVRDNGRGTNGSEEGIGIRGMRERASVVGGSVDYSSDVRGFTITLDLPLHGVQP